MDVSRKVLPFLFLISCSLSAQLTDTVDQLVIDYLGTGNSKEKVDIGNRIMEVNYNLSLEEAKKMFDDYQRRSLKENDLRFRMMGSFILGDVFYYKNDLDSSLYYYLNQAKLGESLQDFLTAVTGFINAAFILKTQGKNLEAIQMIKRADKVSQRGPSVINMSSGYFNLAMIYHNMDVPDSASYYIRRVIEIDREADNLRGMVHNIQFLIDLELRGGNLKEAQELCLQCLELSEKADYLRGQGMCQYSTAFVEYRLQKLDDAIKSINKSIQIYVERKDSARMGQLTRLKANILSSEDPKAAEVLFQQALEYGRESNNVLQLCKTGIDFAKFYLSQNKVDDYRNQINLVKEWSSGKNLADIDFELLNLEYDFYQQRGEYIKANGILNKKVKKQTTKIKDLIQSQANYASQFYELFDMEKELQQAEYENKINQLKAKRRTNILSFIGLAFLLAAFIAYFAYQNQKNKNKLIRKIASEDKLKANNLILEKELDALRSQMNPHFLFNSLNSINDYIMHQDPKEASIYLTKFSRLMRSILNNSKEKLISLQDEINAISLYMELEQLRYKNKFDFEVLVDENITLNNINVPAMLLQPFLENSVKHGMKNLERRGIITLKIRQEEDERIIISIRDNGIGRAEAKKIKKMSDYQRKSHGVTITSERVSLLNNIYGVDASLKYVDHEDPTGTEVIISLYPISKTKANGKYQSSHN